MKTWNAELFHMKKKRKIVPWNFNFFLYKKNPLFIGEEEELCNASVKSDGSATAENSIKNC